MKLSKPEFVEPSSEPSAAAAGGLTPPIVLTAEAEAALPKGVMAQWKLRPRETAPPPRVTRHGKETGLGRVTLCFDADARAMLGTEDAHAFIAELKESVETFLTQHWGDVIGRPDAKLKTTTE